MPLNSPLATTATLLSRHQGMLIEAHRHRCTEVILQDHHRLSPTTRMVLRLLEIHETSEVTFPNLHIQHVTTITLLSIQLAMMITLLLHRPLLTIEEATNRIVIIKIPTRMLAVSGTSISSLVAAALMLGILVDSRQPLPYPPRSPMPHQVSGATSHRSCPRSFPDEQSPPEAAGDSRQISSLLSSLGNVSGPPPPPGEYASHAPSYPPADDASRLPPAVANLLASAVNNSSQGNHGQRDSENNVSDLLALLVSA